MRNALPGLLAAVAVSGLMAGCASTETISQARSATERAQELSQLAAKPMTPADVSPVKVRDDVYVAANAVRNERGDPLPGGWDRRPFVLAKARLASFQEIAAAVTEQTRIPVAVTSINSGSVSVTTARTSGPASVAAPVAGNGLPGDVLAAIQGGGGSSAQTLRASEPPTGDLGISGRMQVRHDGSLPQFLDLVATNFNVAWEYKEGKIVFQRFITRSFDVPALPVASELGFELSSGTDGTTQAGAGGGSSGGSSGAKQKAATTSKFDLWKDLDDTLKQMMAREGGVIQVSPQRGSVTVTGSPATVKHVQDYLRSVNQSLSKQVAINVKVYSVILNDGDNFSSDINLLLQDRFPGSSAVKSAVSISSGSGLAATPAAGLNVLQSGANQGIGWAILNGGRYNGSNGVANLLSEKGDVSVVTSASATALNGQPVPVQVANTRGYVAKVGTTFGGGLTSATQTQIEPGSVTTGFNLHLVPRIQKDGTLMLQYGLNVSELVGAKGGFDEFTTGGQTIQLPNINQRNFIQQAIIPNNATLVLAGFEQVRTSSVKQGQGASFLWPLGGVSNSQVRREILVICITPTIIDATAPTSSIPSAAVQAAR